MDGAESSVKSEYTTLIHKLSYTFTTTTCQTSFGEKCIHIIMLHVPLHGDEIDCKLWVSGTAPTLLYIPKYMYTATIFQTIDIVNLHVLTFLFTGAK